MPVGQCKFNGYTRASGTVTATWETQIPQKLCFAAAAATELLIALSLVCNCVRLRNLLSSAERLRPHESGCSACLSAARCNIL